MRKESADLKHLIESKAFIKYSNKMYDIHKNIEEYNPIRKRKFQLFFMI